MHIRPSPWRTRSSYTAHFLFPEPTEGHLAGLQKFMTSWLSKTDVGSDTGKIQGWGILGISTAYTDWKETQTIHETLLYELKVSGVYLDLSFTNCVKGNPFQTISFHPVPALCSTSVPQFVIIYLICFIACI